MLINLAIGYHFEDRHDAALLTAAGYECEHIPESWKDIGNAERGPKVIGHPEMDVWTREGDGCKDVIVVQRGVVTECELGTPSKHSSDGYF